MDDLTRPQGECPQVSANQRTEVAQPVQLRHRADLERQVIDAVGQARCVRDDDAARPQVLPAAVTARVSVEQASTFGWSQFVGLTGQAIGMKTFGASAPLKELLKKFGFTPDAVVAAAKEQVARTRR